MSTEMQKNKWGSDAETAMMGITVRVSGEENLRYLVEYVLSVISDQIGLRADCVHEKSVEVATNAINKYNSENTEVRWFVVNSTGFGLCMTFVRDNVDRITGMNGVLAWVENLTYPDCSELGYVFFSEDEFGLIRRIG